MSRVVWTGASQLRVKDGVIPMWEAVDLDADAIRWLIRRKIHVRPLLSVDEAIEVAKSASDATLNVIAERLRLSGDHESVRGQILVRLGASIPAETSADTEPDDGQNAPNLDARRSLVFELRESGETWENVAQAMEISVTSARKDHSIWAERVQE